MAPAGDDQTPAPKAPEQPAVAPAAAARNRNMQIFAGGLFVAIVIGVFIVVAFGGSGKKPAPVDAPTAEARAATTTLLSGIPQNGFVLGDPKAPMNLVEFLDVQCPFCAAHEIDQQPTVIKDLIRTGKATLTMQPINGLGGQSEAGRVAVANMAGINKAWDFLNIWYFIQPQENTGYITPTFLSKIGTAALGSTPAADQIATTPSRDAVRLLNDADTNAKALKVDQTPFFAIGRTGQPIATYKAYDTGQSSTAAGQQLVDAVNEAAEKAGL